MIDYFCGSSEKILSILFKMFDFDKDKFISKNDVMTILQALPLLPEV